jgi:molybdate transport system substrate-binding protein
MRPAWGPTARRSSASVGAAVLVASLAACGSGAGGGSTGTTLSVYAASSLTATFTELAKEFEQRHDGVSVELSFGGSSDLVAQIQQGAPADVVASADTDNMDKLVSDDLVAKPVPFATNRLEIAVPPDNPAHVRTLVDLGRNGLDLVACAPEVPCGAAAQEVARRAGVALHPVSEEQSVTDVVGKVISGEADAGLVYVTDVLSAGDKVTGIEFPESRSVLNTYPIARVAGSSDSSVADEFIGLVTGAQGQAVLAGAGFGKP